MAAPHQIARKFGRLSEVKLEMKNAGIFERWVGRVVVVRATV